MKFFLPLLFSLLAAVTAWQLEPNCGVKGPEEAIEGRIIGGQEAAPHEFPWQVQQVLPWNHRLFCGASVLNKDWLITAGHCAMGNDIQYYFGTNQAPMTGEPADATIRLAAKFIVHPQFNLYPIHNDIALVKLSQSLPLSNASAHIQPICLPEAEEDLNEHAGRPATISGFGNTKPGEDSSLSNVLRKVNATIWKQEECSEAWTQIQPNFDMTVTENMICALSYGKTACHGDSGGPMMTYNDKTGRWQLTGIVSWGQPACDKPYHPAVYTRVSKYLDWIKATIEAN